MYLHLGQETVVRLREVVGIFDMENATIRINKSYQRLNGQDVVTTPKTPKSNRTVTIPAVLVNCLKEYMAQCYDLQPDDRLFPYTKHYLNHEMEGASVPA